MVRKCIRQLQNTFVDQFFILGINDALFPAEGFSQTFNSLCISFKVLGGIILLTYRLYCLSYIVRYTQFIIDSNISNQPSGISLAIILKGLRRNSLCLDPPDNRILVVIVCCCCRGCNNHFCSRNSLFRIWYIHIAQIVIYQRRRFFDRLAGILIRKIFIIEQSLF